MCHGEIHPERLAMNARGRTCSHTCVAGLRKRGKAEAVTRLRARRREAQGVKGPMSRSQARSWARKSKGLSSGAVRRERGHDKHRGTATASLSCGARRYH